MAQISPTTSGRPFPDLSSLSLTSTSLSTSAMEDHHLHLPLHKATISGPTLSSLINRFISSPSNTHGILFGTFSLYTPLSDDSLTAPSSALIATITGFLSTSTTSADLSSLLRDNHRHVIGWFSARRRSPLRPSLRECAITRSLTSSENSPRLFLLLTTPVNDNLQTLIHTHEYRVYDFVRSDCSFEATALDVVNIGPAFRGHYSAFSTNSELPWLPCEVQSGSPMKEDMNLKEMKRVAKDQKDLEAYVEKGYELGSLSRLVGNDAVGYMGGVEELYEKMLAKLDSLARQVECSNAKVLEMVKSSSLFALRRAWIKGFGRKEEGPTYNYTIIHNFPIPSLCFPFKSINSYTPLLLMLKCSSD